MFSLRAHLTRRKVLLYLIILFAFSTFRFRWSSQAVAPTQPIIFPPPTYSSVYDLERNLPQHNLDLPYPEGRTGRYVKFSNQIAGLGWNNVLNDLCVEPH